MQTNTHRQKHGGMFFPCALHAAQPRHLRHSGLQVSQFAWSQRFWNKNYGLSMWRAEIWVTLCKAPEDRRSAQICLDGGQPLPIYLQGLCWFVRLRDFWHALHCESWNFNSFADRQLASDCCPHSDRCLFRAVLAGDVPTPLSKNLSMTSTAWELYECE